MDEDLYCHETVLLHIEGYQAFMLTFSVGFKAASNSEDVSVEQLSSFMFLEEDS